MRENLNKTPFKKIIGLISCIPKKSLLLFVAGSFGIAFLFCMSRVSWRVNWYSTPDFSFSFLIRTFMIALSVLAILYSVKTGNLSRKIEFTSEQKIALHAILTLTVVGFFLCVVFPETARILGEEDNLIEWLSFALLFLSLGMIVSIFLKGLVSLKDNRLVYLALLLFAFLLFFMGMEEISWGQRLFGLQTPETFRGNSQNELNLHNFVTTEADTLYYIGICFLLIIIPYLKLCFPIVFSRDFFKIFVPGPFIIIIGVLPFAFHYHKWNLLFTQMWFFSALVITVILAFSQKRLKTGSYYLLTSFLISFIQLTFLVGDDPSSVLVSGRVAEYKELISQTALLVYSRNVYLVLKKSR